MVRGHVHDVDIVFVLVCRLALDVAESHECVRAASRDSLELFSSELAVGCLAEGAEASRATPLLLPRNLTAAGQARVS